jgi:secreted trypsin-like serine protease
MRNRILALVVLSCLWLACSVWSSDAIGATGDPHSIVGGTPVADGDWPDAVAVLGTRGTCTGTLVAPDVVLTAGHCIDVTPWLVVVDTTDLAAGDGERIGVRDAIAYPDWESTFDVGVLVLDRPAATPPRAVARTCTMHDHLRRDAEVVVVGFGDSDPRGDDNTAKLAATVRVADPRCTVDPSCAEAIGPGAEFIAGGARDAGDACFGDSGGPAYMPTASGPVVAGVVSRGLAGEWACGGGTVYVRTDRVAAWIEEVTGRQLERPACEEGGGDDPGDAAYEATAGCAVSGSGAGILLVFLALGALVFPGGHRRARAL